MQNKKIEELKEQIGILEKELKAVKNALAVMEATEDVVFEETDSIYDEDIRMLDLDLRDYRYLKRQGIYTVRDLISSFNNGMLTNRVNRELCLKLRNFKQSPTTAITTYIKEKRDFEKQIYESSFRVLSALEIYSKIRRKAKENDIVFNGLGRYGKFASWKGIEKFIRERQRAYEMNCLEECGSVGRVLEKSFLEECQSGQHPKIFEMLCAAEITTELVKEAIIEDVTEAISSLNKESNSYQEGLRFLELVREFE